MFCIKIKHLQIHLIFKLILPFGLFTNLVACSNFESSTPSPTDMALQVTPTKAPTSTPTPSISPTPGASATPTPRPSNSPTPTISPTPPPPATGALRPYWRKPLDGSPSWSPDWYQNLGPITREVVHATDATNLESIIENAAPGDHILIRGGRYVLNGNLSFTKNASAANPTVIRGAPGENIIIEQPSSSRNVIEISGSYMIIENITFTGGSIGLRIMSFNYLFFYNNEIAYTPENSMSANSGNTSHLYFVDNEFHHAGGTGEGFYLGGHTGSPVCHSSKVIGNYVHDNMGPSVEQGDGIEIKKNSYGNEVKWNFVQNTNYPGIIAYGTGGNAKNIIEENVIINHPDSSDYGMQVAADAIIRNNLVIARNCASAFSSQSHNGVTPANLEVINNTFISCGSNSARGSWSLSNNFVFANNAYNGSLSGISSSNSVFTNNLSVNLSAFVYLTLDGIGLNPTPAAGSNLISGANASRAPASDIFGRTRLAPFDVGAAESY